LNRNDYIRLRSKLLEDDSVHIMELEKKYMDFLTKVTLRAAPSIDTDFSRSTHLVPFWANYPPKQRGRQPKGTSIPWSEYGDKCITPNLLKTILYYDKTVRFPGVPFGGDTRFATDDAFVHFDVKLTGPNDNPDEIVASPNQVSGDGIDWNEKGVVNSIVQVQGPRATMTFRPELPPFYIEGNKIIPCLTYFLKAVYIVKSFGVQPVDYMELVCTPNGLLMFDGPRYANRQGLLIPGKDVKTFAHKRTRIRLAPLARLDDWRCVKILRDNAKWKAQKRYDSSSVYPLFGQA